MLSNSTTIIPSSTNPDSNGIFTGYACLFGQADLGRDVIEPGAFRNTLSKAAKGDVKMLYQHDPLQPIGIWHSIVEDGIGLRVKGSLLMQLARSQEVLSLMRAGVLSGLSIGFRVRKSWRNQKSRLRHIQSVDLWEISIVTFPMQPRARVDFVKTELNKEPSLVLRKIRNASYSINTGEKRI